MPELCAVLNEQVATRALETLPAHCLLHHYKKITQGRTQGILIQAIKAKCFKQPLTLILQRSAKAWTMTVFDARHLPEIIEFDVSQEDSLKTLVDKLQQESKKIGLKKLLKDCFGTEHPEAEPTHNKSSAAQAISTHGLHYTPSSSPQVNDFTTDTESLLPEIRI